MNNLLNFDLLTNIILSLVALVSIFVALFSKNYLAGDSKQKTFYFNLFVTTISVLFVVCANNIWFFLVAWIFANTFLVRLMIHKKSWGAAFATGKLAMTNFVLGFVLLFISIFTIYHFTRLDTFKEIFIVFSNQDVFVFDIFGFKLVLKQLIFLLILIVAMIQSAQIPFSSWLLSSLNSPTPVSAFMHAGLVNGGGILLAKFSPLFLDQPSLLTLIFIIGSVTALFGTSAMLVQAKIKNKLAASTVGQMGFMFMEVGLGLIPVAITHLIMHGFFKAYLFLSSGSSVDRVNLAKKIYKPIPNFIFAIIFTIIATMIFSKTSGFSIFDGDTRVIQCIFVMLTIAQFIFTCFVTNTFMKFKLGVVLIAFALAALYGMSVDFFEKITHELELTKFQEINFFHIFFTSIFVFLWLFNNLHNAGLLIFKFLPGSLKNFIYMKLAAYSEPNLNTITTARGDYRY